MIEEKDTVANEHPLYKGLQIKRQYVKDVRAGTLRLRARKDIYLPKFPEELTATYENRAKCSTLFNLYAKTEAVMTGLVFQNEIELGADVPGAIKLLAENIDNKGTHLNVFAREVFEKSFDGCSLILVDMPPASEQVVSLEDERRLELRPYWTLYEASAVTNWQTRINPVSKSTEISLIVFKEITKELAGRFLFKDAVRYRVWFLNENNQVAWEVWREVQENNLSQITYIKESEGICAVLTQIPVAVVGKLEAEPPLLDLALLNIKHFQKESNFDNLEVQAAVPLFYTKGLDKGADVLPVGADIHYQLSADGDIGWAQIDASGFESMRNSLDKLVEQMARLGLSLLANKDVSVDLTATEALLNNIGETAELRVMATSEKDALELALGYTAEFLGLGKDKGGSITLGTAWTKLEIQSDLGDGMIKNEGDPQGSEMVN